MQDSGGTWAQEVEARSAVRSLDGEKLVASMMVDERSNSLAFLVLGVQASLVLKALAVGLIPNQTWNEFARRGLIPYHCARTATLKQLPTGMMAIARRYMSI